MSNAGREGWRVCMCVCVYKRNRRDTVEGEKHNEKRQQINLIVTLASVTAVSKVSTVSILAAITGIPL